jgi:hypothetical protein
MVLGYILGDFLQTHLATLVNYFIRTILQVTKKLLPLSEIGWRSAEKISLFHHTSSIVTILHTTYLIHGH